MKHYVGGLLRADLLCSTLCGALEPGPETCQAGGVVLWGPLRYRSVAFGAWNMQGLKGQKGIEPLWDAKIF